MLQALLLLFAGAAIALIADRLRWRHEDKRHWESERRDLYTRFLAALDEWRELDWVLAMELGYADGPDWEHAGYLVPGTDETVAGRLRLRVGEATEKVASALAEMQLYGSATTTAGAQDLWAQARAVASVGREFPPRHCGGVSDALLTADEELASARAGFVESVRSDLGVPE